MYTSIIFIAYISIDCVDYVRCLCVSMALDESVRKEGYVDIQDQCFEFTRQHFQDEGRCS
jgi:hypothetical protein